MSLLLLLVACGTAPTPTPTPAPVAAPPPAPPPAAVGPDGPEHLAIPSVSASADPETLKKGEAVFASRGCGSCHAFGSKVVGPDLVGVGKRRTPAWMARMIKYPEIMIKEDPVAKGLYTQLMVPMANQGATDEEIASVVAFLASK